MDTAWTFCGSDVRPHDPVVVEEGFDARRAADQFRTYARLARHIDAKGIETGACCRRELSGG